MPATDTPEARARRAIDIELGRSGWIVQGRAEMNVYAARGVAVREFLLATGHGFADYLLFVDGRAVGVLEAKPEGHTLSGVEVQADRYARGLPRELKSAVRPLPFLYLSTGAITRFTNLLDPDARGRDIFAIHRPETLADWLSADTLDAWVRSTGAFTSADATKPSSLRSRLRAMPALAQGTLWPVQFEAIANLENSLRLGHPRALIQMSTGSGKTMTAVAESYRLMKFAGARRVLFLVDRDNLGEQAEGEFKSFRSPDDRRKFDELYNINRLTSNKVPSASSVVITTIQRLYSMLRGEPENATVGEDGTAHEPATPVEVAYNARVPPEFFDAIFVDKCHRSIYSTWRQVLEYFDAFIVGPTATPAAHTYGFFNGNVVMEYSQPNVNGSKLKACPIPLPPLAEQQRIVTEISRLLSVADEVAQTTSTEPARCARLRQAILKAAFEGKLVDQDPTDEPASVLLARIRAERASGPGARLRARR